MTHTAKLLQDTYLFLEVAAILLLATLIGLAVVWLLRRKRRTQNKTEFIPFTEPYPPYSSPYKVFCKQLIKPAEDEIVMTQQEREQIKKNYIRALMAPMDNTDSIKRTLTVADLFGEAHLQKHQTNISTPNKG